MATGRPAERAERFALLAADIDGAGLFQGDDFIDVQEGPDLGLALADGFEELARQSLGGDLALVQERAATRWRCVRS